jgi:hypothetical protein
MQPAGRPGRIWRARNCRRWPLRAPSLHPGGRRRRCAQRQQLVASLCHSHHHPRHEPRHRRRGRAALVRDGGWRRVPTCARASTRATRRRWCVIRRAANKQIQLAGERECGSARRCTALLGQGHIRAKARRRKRMSHMWPCRLIVRVVRQRTHARQRGRTRFVELTRHARHQQSPHRCVRGRERDAHSMQHVLARRPHQGAPINRWRRNYRHLVHALLRACTDREKNAFS